MFLKKYSQFGRSMIEMIGALAIIGVLSVGALAGYSHAMMKYKLNRQSQDLSFIWSGMIQLCLETDCSQIPFYPEPTLRKIGIIPTHLKASPHGIYDIFGNNCHIAQVSDKFSMGCETKTTTFEQCVNIVQTATAFAEDMSVGLSNLAPTWYSSHQCDDKKKPCLSKITLNDIEKFCSEIPNNTNISVQIYYKKLS